MSVKNRAKNEKRQRRKRKRALALPFIVSIAMAPACTTSSGQQQQNTTPPPPPAPATKVAKAEPRPAPPPPAPAPTPAPPRADKASASPGAPAVKPRPMPRNPPRPPRKLPDIPKNANGTLRVDNAGNCVFSFRATCRPNVKCNPPPPRKVNCPTDLPKNNSTGKAFPGIVRKSMRRGTVVCRFFFNTSCPPNTRCNPPPPRKVKCW